MNYSLTSSRKIGKYYQKIITTYFGAPKATNEETINKLKSWHEIIDGCNRSHEDEKGDIRYLGFTENEGSGSTNDGDIVDGTFVVLSIINGIPKTTTFSLKDVPYNKLIERISVRFGTLVYSNFFYGSNYLISAVLDLH